MTAFLDSIPLPLRLVLAFALGAGTAWAVISAACDIGRSR